MKCGKIIKFRLTFIMKLTKLVKIMNSHNFLTKLRLSENVYCLNFNEKWKIYKISNNYYNLTQIWVKFMILNKKN